MVRAGGIATVLDKDDHFDAHIDDTLKAGDGLCHPEVVRAVVEGGPEAIEKLTAWGMPFTKDGKTGKNDHGFHLYKEGGHSKRRVAHVGDHTGRDLWTTLHKKALSFQQLVL